MPDSNAWARHVRPNESFHLTAIPLRSIATGELKRYAARVALSQIWRGPCCEKLARSFSCSRQ